MGKLYSRNDVIYSLKIDDTTNFVVQKSSECRFYEDDVYIKIITPNRCMLVLEDSFEFSAYIELVHSIDRLIKADIGTTIHAVGAPCNKGGLELFFKKESCNVIVFSVNKQTKFTKIDNKFRPYYRTVFSKNVDISLLLQLREDINDIYNNRMNVFFPNQLPTPPTES